jgi:SAM-dependent methyltransferase
MHSLDIFGQALLEYYHGLPVAQLQLHNQYGSPEPMPVDIFFRSEEEMPELELMALNLCSGKILDIGAGVGSHALALQNRAADVTALEISSAACGIMFERGVKHVLNKDIMGFRTEGFDSLLLLMNGIGLTGSLEGLRRFLNLAKSWLNPGGSLICDSSDISYLYADIPLPESKYFGELSYQYEYKGKFGNWFNWLYIDAQLLNTIAKQEGWTMEFLFDDQMDQYLARLTPVS